MPYLCNFAGWALFADGSDMLCRSDIAELFDKETNGDSAVLVVKHDYTTKHARKYIGTELEAPNEDYPRKNWSSLMLWNCGAAMNQYLTPQYVERSTSAHLHRFGWLPDDRIGSLPLEWNWLADEYGHNEQAKLLHWTAGQPGFYHYHNVPHAEEWRASVRDMTKGME